MGINPTQSNFKSFTFDGENSRNYGVYITGQGVFNAPERNVEMIEIPNRNGAYALDKGNFNNIEVTYPAGIFADTEADFAQAVSDLRNFLCSRVGYVRLEDDYNTGEYRMAIYKSGLEVSHDMLIVGEFDIVFECKPQRFLKSGETAVSVTNGDTITNPTRFDAKPLLEVYGYGTIGINGNSLSVEYVQMGMVKISPSKTRTITTEINIINSTIDNSMLNAGDSIIVDGQKEEITIRYGSGFSVTSATITSLTPGCSASCSFTSDSVTIYASYNTWTFQNGTSSYPSNPNGVATYVVNGTTKTVSFSGVCQYNGTNKVMHWVDGTGIDANATFSVYQYVPDIYGNSTKTATGNPLYIDLDIGEAYNTDSGSPISVNDAVIIPAELPVLSSGANTITYNNTITQLDIVPRWWQV